VNALFPFSGVRIVTRVYARIKTGITRRAAETRLRLIIDRNRDKQSGQQNGKGKEFSVDPQTIGSEHINLLDRWDMTFGISPNKKNY
jgi:hypothetical protein